MSREAGGRLPATLVVSPYVDATAVSLFIDISNVSSYADIMSARQLINARSLPRLGTAVTGMRNRRGMTQAELAQAAGVSRQWISSLENGRTPGLEVARLLRLLDVLNATLMIQDEGPLP